MAFAFILFSFIFGDLSHCDQLVCCIVKILVTLAYCCNSVGLEVNQAQPKIQILNPNPTLNPSQSNLSETLNKFEICSIELI